LIDELHAPDELAAATLRVARQLASASRESIAAINTLCRDVVGHGLEAQLAREHRLLKACATGPDGREGVAAFAQRRAPEFNGDPSGAAPARAPDPDA
jgi:2-(1,2-epoxy-1,2-dihydrophenyl)acetyl-CoA isomerase